MTADVSTLTSDLATLTTDLASRDARISSLVDARRQLDDKLAVAVSDAEKFKMAAEESKTESEALQKEVKTSKDLVEIFKKEAATSKKQADASKMAAETSKMAAEASSESDVQLSKLKSVNRDLLKVGVELREKIGQLIAELASIKKNGEKVKTEFNAEVKVGLVQGLSWETV